MARLPYLTRPDLPERDRDLLDRDINLHRLLAHSPAGARAFSHLSNWIRYQSALDARLRELVILQIGYCSQSAYEFSHHIKIGRDFGVSDKDINALISETRGEDTLLSELDKIALRAARELVKHGAIEKDTLSSLKTLLSNQEIVELTMIASFYIGVVHLLASLDIDVETDHQPYLSEFPFADKQLNTTI